MYKKIILISIFIVIIGTLSFIKADSILLFLDSSKNTEQTKKDPQDNQKIATTSKTSLKDIKTKSKENTIPQEKIYDFMELKQVKGIPYKFNKHGLDSDEDYLTNKEELEQYNTNPNNPDTDGDGFIDGVELDIGTNPLSKDSDNDGLTDGDEINKYKTDPINPDTDEDGYLDGQEIEHGYDPLKK